MGAAVVNVMELVAKDLLHEFEKTYGLACHYEECQLDILSLALNSIPPKYVSTHKGEMIVKAMYTDHRLKQDILKELLFAAAKVEKHPRHQLKTN